MQTILKDTGETVNVLHHGFDMAIVVINGKQQCINISKTTLNKRDRPNKPKR